MVIKKNKEVIHIYNKKIETLVIVFLDDNHSIYNVEGWFGKKLDEFLKSDGNLGSFLEGTAFKNNSQLGEVFKRLIATLMKADILLPSEGEGPVSIQPLSEDEYLNFGQGKDFTGSFSVSEELLAYADHLVDCGHNLGGVEEDELETFNEIDPSDCEVILH